ncbi:MAG: hydrolase [Clostridiales bacterium]|nr:hydrolase [Clostridiales bacterium]
MEKFILRKEDSVILIIDIQERLVPAMEDGQRVIDNTNILMTLAKGLEMPILVTEQYPKGLGPTVSEIRENLDKPLIYEKTSFTAYTDDIAESLKKLGRKKVIITGMETHVCVFQTIRDLIADGYEVFLVKDAVCSRTKENYNNALDMMKTIGAFVTNTESVLFDLMKESGSPIFKKISKLIK